MPPAAPAPRLGLSARRYKLIKVSTSLNVSDWTGEMFGVDLNQVDADCYHLMIDRFAEAKARADKDVTAGEDVL